jgi:hypothetical protein
MSLLTRCSQRLTRYLDLVLHPCLPVCPLFADHPNDAEGRGRVVSDAERSEARRTDPARGQRWSGTQGACGRARAQQTTTRAAKADR